MVLGSCYLISGYWFLVLSSLFLFHGSWFLVPGSWFLVPDSWFSVPGSLLLVPESDPNIQFLVIGSPFPRRIICILIKIWPTYGSFE